MSSVPILLLFRKRWRMFALLFITSAALVVGLLWRVASDIASPRRRALQDYHREYLSNPADHGMRVKQSSASDGTPYLVCEPSDQVGKKGGILRTQLAGRGFRLADPGEVLGTLMLIHGRTARKEDFLPVAERMCAAGFRCVLPDMPGHGDHPRKTATYGVNEGTLPALILKDSAKQFGFPEDAVGLLGMSMGGSISVHSAAIPDAPWKALVVIASFDRLSSAVTCRSSSFVGPAAPFATSLLDRFYQQMTGIPFESIQPCRKASSVRIPVLVAHGTRDEVTPLSGGKELFQSFSASHEKRWIEVPGATHNNVLVTDYPVYADVAEWMLRHVAGMSHAPEIPR